jgi:hypothetical protein
MSRFVGKKSRFSHKGIEKSSVFPLQTSRLSASPTTD